MAKPRHWVKNIIVADTLSFIEAPGIAEYLARQGKSVEIITHHSAVGLELKIMNHWQHVLPRLFANKIKISPFTWISKIQGKKVSVYNVYYKQDRRELDGIDNVVLITGKIQNDSLYHAFEGKVSELYLVGDANIGGARIGNAMYDSQRIGRTI